MKSHPIRVSIRGLTTISPENPASFMLFQRFFYQTVTVRAPQNGHFVVKYKPGARRRLTIIGLIGNDVTFISLERRAPE